jgi:PadR family transcriptional regulator PadR
MESTATPYHSFQYALVGAVVSASPETRRDRNTITQKTHPAANTTLTLHMHDLTGFQRDLLYVIAGNEEPHGLALKDDLDDYYEQEIHHGRLYPNLDTVVEKGLVEKGTIDRRTNSYELTQRGAREIDARQEWEAQYSSS